MRGFQCHYYHMNNNVLVKNTNTSCWAGFNMFYLDNKILYKTIYIEQFTEEKTSKYIPLLIRVINKITPCKIVSIEDKEYIQFDLLSTYNQSLVLLNFIRNLWADNKDPISMISEGITNKYTEVFFETLRTSKFYKDPMKRLTYANIIAIEQIKINRSFGHSNIHDPKTLKIRDLVSLLEYKGTSTHEFLKGNN